MEAAWLLPTDRSWVESNSSSALEKLDIIDRASSSLSSIVLSSDDELGIRDRVDLEKDHRPDR
jgi:hypothetical protein